MAAHSVSILSEFVQRRPTAELRKRLAHALDYAPGLSVLPYDDYVRLSTATVASSDAALVETLQDVWNEQIKIWCDLGLPTHYEDWRRVIASRL